MEINREVPGVLEWQFGRVTEQQQQIFQDMWSHALKFGVAVKFRTFAGSDHQTIELSHNYDVIIYDERTAVTLMYKKTAPSVVNTQI